VLSGFGTFARSKLRSRAPIAKFYSPGIFNQMPRQMFAGKIFPETVLFALHLTEQMFVCLIFLVACHNYFDQMCQKIPLDLTFALEQSNLSKPYSVMELSLKFFGKQSKHADIFMQQCYCFFLYYFCIAYYFDSVKNIKN